MRKLGANVIDTFYKGRIGRIRTFKSNRKNGRSYVIVDQAKEGHGFRQDGRGVDVNLVAAVHEGSEMHLKGPGDVIEGDPLT